MAKFKNDSNVHVKDAVLGIDCPPGKTCEVADAYARPIGHEHANYESIVTRRCPHLKLIEDAPAPQAAPLRGDPPKAKKG